jgi:hypothetical protein
LSRCSRTRTDELRCHLAQPKTNASTSQPPIISNSPNDSYNLSIGVGLSQVNGRVFRIGHLGNMDELMMCSAISGAEMAMIDAGMKIAPGSGISKGARLRFAFCVCVCCRVCFLFVVGLLAGWLPAALSLLLSDGKSRNPASKPCNHRRSSFNLNSDRVLAEDVQGHPHARVLKGLSAFRHQRARAHAVYVSTRA